MIKRCLLVSVITLLPALAMVAVAQAPVTLEYKYLKDQAISIRASMTGTGSVSVENVPNAPEGMVIPMTMTITSDGTQKVKEMLADGTAWILQTTDKMTMVQEIMGQKTEMTAVGGKVTKLLVNGQEADEQTKAKANPAETGLWGEDIEMRLDKTGRVMETKGKLWEYLQKIMPALDVGVLAEASTSASMGLPDHPIAVGESWKREYSKKVEVANAEPAEIGFVATFKLEGMEEVGGVQTAKIPFEQTFETTNLPMHMPKEQGAGGEQTTVNQMKMKSTGTLWFAPGKGQPVKAEMKLNLDMKMTSQMGDQTTPINLKMRNMTASMVFK